jgi:hypothetical protein
MVSGTDIVGHLATSKRSEDRCRNQAISLESPQGMQMSVIEIFRQLSL